MGEDHEITGSNVTERPLPIRYSARHCVWPAKCGPIRGGDAAGRLVHLVLLTTRKLQLGIWSSNGKAALFPSRWRPSFFVHCIISNLKSSRQELPPERRSSTGPALISEDVVASLYGVIPSKISKGVATAIQCRDKRVRAGGPTSNEIDS